MTSYTNEIVTTPFPGHYTFCRKRTDGVCGSTCRKSKFPSPDLSDAFAYVSDDQIKLSLSGTTFEKNTMSYMNIGENNNDVPVCEYTDDDGLGEDDTPVREWPIQDEDEDEDEDENEDDFKGKTNWRYYVPPPQVSTPENPEHESTYSWNNTGKWNETEPSVFVNIVHSTTTTKTTTTEVHFKGTVTKGPRMGNKTYTQTMQGAWMRNRIEQREARTRIYTEVASRPSRSHTHVQKTCMCKSVGTKFPCRYGDRCRFAHTIDELEVPRCRFGDKCKKYKNKKACKFGAHTEEQAKDMKHIAQCSWQREERRRTVISTRTAVRKQRLRRQKTKKSNTPTITEDYIDCCKFEWPAKFEKERNDFVSMYNRAWELRQRANSP